VNCLTDSFQHVYYATVAFEGNSAHIGLPGFVALDSCCSMLSATLRSARTLTNSFAPLGPYAARDSCVKDFVCIYQKDPYTPARHRHPQIEDATHTSKSLLDLQARASLVSAWCCIPLLKPCQQCCTRRQVPHHPDKERTQNIRTPNLLLLHNCYAAQFNGL
jgi:hypothetical protein